MSYYIVSNMNAKKNVVRNIEKDMKNFQKEINRSQEDIKKNLGDDITAIKKEVNSLKVELMKIKSDLLKEKEFDKIHTSEATSETPIKKQEDETKDNIAKGYWWS
tara:strand:+ start:928 stop:1242 length:315 start_codon:yes stop_codon:yes gene_type:complete